MRLLVREKEIAITLRKKGLSYRDILREISVAKSTLSVWLKDLPVTKEEKKSLRKRKDSNISQGKIKAAAALRRKRLERERAIFLKSKEEFVEFVREPLFHTGVALYWAEGSKRSQLFRFSNSDPAMMTVMLDWIERFLYRKRYEIFVRLYTHRPFMNDRAEEYWSREINIPLKNFKKTIYKPTGLLVKKRPNYRGCLRLELPRGKAALVKILFWKRMLIDYYASLR